MNVLEAQSESAKKTTRIFITQKDVASLLGCGKSKAYGIVKEVNKYAKKKGYHPFPAGRANKYLFSDLYKIPIVDIDLALSNEEVSH